MAQAKKRTAKKTTMTRVKKLKTDYEALRAAMPAIGSVSTPPNGLEDLVGRVKNVEVLIPDGEIEVTASASIYPEDMVAITQELTRSGETVRLVNGNASFLAAVNGASMKNTGEDTGPVVVVFAQDGKTYIKAARWDPGASGWVLGATCLLLDGVLDKAVIIPYQTGYQHNQNGSRYFAVFYREDDMGMVQFWEVDPVSLTTNHYGTDIWTDEAPVNLCGAWTPYSVNYGLGSGLRVNYSVLLTLVYQGRDGTIRVTGIVPRWNWNEDEQKNYITASIWADKTILPGEHIGVEMVEGKHHDFTVVAPDTQEYASSAWALTAGKGIGSMWLTYPGEDGNRYILELWATEDRYTEETTRVYQYEPGACKKLIQSGYQACGAGLYGLNMDGSYSGRGPYFLGTISRLSGPNQRASVGIEGWTGGYESQLTPLWFGEEDQTYQSNVGLISTCRAGKAKELMAVGYAVEEKYYGFLLGWHGDEYLGGPQVELADVGVAAALVESYEGTALVYQTGDSIYLQQVSVKTVAAPTTKSRAANAQAVTGGRPGQVIKINGLKG